MLVGRQTELASIDRMLRLAVADRGEGLVVRGEAGIGKSALLEHAVARAQDFRVLRAVGVEAESQLAYAALHQLLLPLLNGADRLPAPQADALHAAFGLRAGGVSQPFLVSIAALTLMSAAAEDRPVLGVIDDAQWCDGASMDAFAFVARRLEAEPIALLAAVRDGEGRNIDAGGMTELRLTGLDLESAAQLLAGRVSPALLGPLVRSTGGNPLALLELSHALTGSELAQQLALLEPLPLAGQLEEVFLGQARQLRPSAGRALLIAAAEGAGSRESIRLAARYLDVDSAAIDSAEAAGLLRADGEKIVFRHPLMRSAVYQGAAPADRRAVHRALARALSGDRSQADRRAWHLARATSGPDDSVAADLEHSAEQALNRSGYLAAAAALERAAELSSGPEDQARRLVAAARASWNGGDTEAAVGLLERAERLRPQACRVPLEILHLRGSIDLRAGSPADALTVLVPAAAAAADVDPDLALRLVLLAREAVYTTADTAALPLLASAVSKLPPFGRPRDQLLARALSSFVGPRIGPQRAGELAAELRRLAGLVQFDDPELLLITGGMAWAVGDYPLAARLRRDAAARARSMGAAGTLALTLEYLVPEEIAAGHYAAATALAVEGRRLATETGRRNSACLQGAFLSLLAGLRGSEAEARELADQAMAEAVARRLVKVADVAQRARGLLALASRQPQEALVAFNRLDGSGPEPGSPVMAVSAIPDHIEAAIRCGAADQARALLTRYREWADPIGAPLLRALAARCAALLAPTSGLADAEYRTALTLHAAAGYVFDHARTELLYGEFLRRGRQRARAREHLRSAMDAFDRLGTPVWAERARTELRATGETARKRVPAATEQLTPQELQIALITSAGATNHEIAGQLFISPRTVDYHLRKVFQKLGISSRRELMLLGLDGDRRYSG
jgi:DNA-binding CsgD family transcriptional regulator